MLYSKWFGPIVSDVAKNKGTGAEFWRKTKQ